MNLQDNVSVQSLLDSMKYYNIKPDATTYTQLLNVYHKQDDARAFEKLASYCLTNVEMDNVLLTVILKKHVQDYERFMSMWDKYAHTPDIELYELRIRAALFEGFEAALEVLKEAVDNGTKYRVETYSLFVIYFCKRGEMENAQKAFDAACTIGKPTSKMTTLMLQGYCKLDKRKHCIATCEEFMKHQIYPRATDAYTVLDVLTRLEEPPIGKRFCEYLDEIKFKMCIETHRLYRKLRVLESQ
jgi:tetratricopeptide (TPR) repeat protein